MWDLIIIHTYLLERCRNNEWPRQLVTHTLFHLELTFNTRVNVSQIYDLKNKRFRDDLEDDHPSLDGSVKKPKLREGGAENVTNELDLFNYKYEKLCTDIQDKLKSVGDENPDDPKIQVNQRYVFKIPVNLTV